MPRVKASSLVEVIIAALLITTVFGLSIAVFLNVQRSSYSYRKLKADILIQESVTKMLAQKKFSEVESIVDDFIIHKEVYDYQWASNIKILKWQVNDANGTLVSERKRLIYVPNK